MNKVTWKNGLLAIAIVAIISAIYFLTPVKDYLTIEKVKEVTESVPQNATAVIACLVLFLIGGAMLVPIPLMALAVSLIFDPIWAVCIALLGFALAGSSGYLLGRFIDPDVFGKNFERKLDKINKQLNGKGAWAVLALRMAPTPPFTVTSMMCGTLRLNFKSYILGTIVGIAPLGLSAVLFGKGAIEAMRDPSGIAISFIIAAVALLGVYYAIKHKQNKQTEL